MTVTMPEIYDDTKSQKLDFQEDISNESQDSYQMEDMNVDAEKTGAADQMLVLNGMIIKNTEDLMFLLNKDPNMQTQLVQIINLINDPGLQRKSIISESTPIDECITPEDGKLLNSIAQTQMVLSPCNLPGDSPSYAMNTAPSSPSSSPCQMPLCIPTEYTPETPPRSPEGGMKIMEESSNDGYVDEEDEKRPIDMTFGPAELKLSTIYSNVSPNIVSPELLTFCDKMNSPDYDYSECIDSVANVDDFENSVVQPTCSPNDLQEPPEYAVSLKENSLVEPVSPNLSASTEYAEYAFTNVDADISLENSVVEHTCSPNNLTVSPEYAFSPKSPLADMSPISPEWVESPDSGIASPPSSICCEDSDVENDVNEMQHDALPFCTSDNIDFNIGDILTSFMLSQCGVPLVAYGMTNQYDTNPADPLLLAACVPFSDVLSSSDPEDVGYDSDHPVPLSGGASPVSVVSSTYDMEGPQNDSNNSMEFEELLDSSSICADSPLSTVSTSDCISLQSVLPNASTIFVGDNCHVIETEQIDCDDDYQGSAKKRRKVDTSVQHKLPKNETLDRKDMVYKEYYMYLDNHPVCKKDKDGDLPLHTSVLRGDIESTKFILDIMGGYKINAKNLKQQTPLHFAGYTRNVQMMYHLIQSGADPEITDADGNNMMHIACINSSMEILEVLEACYMADPCKIMGMLKAHNYEGLTPLHEAAKKRDMDVINFLLQKLNCNLDMKELKVGMTVLVQTLDKHDWELAQLFITCGASLNEATNFGMCALDYLATSDNMELAKDLINRGAESGVKNEFINKEMKVLFESELRKRRRKGKKRTRTARSD